MSPPLSVLLLLCVASSAAAREVSLPLLSLKPSAYEVLESFGFPVGLLPKGVRGYDLDPATGRFSAYLDGTCAFSVDSYQLRYRPTISGVISGGRLSSLQGVSVKVLFFWFNIVEVTRHADRLGFSVGILSADFPVESFQECLQCGCGLNCGGAPGRPETGRRPL